ncbi:MAG: carboxypeptidase-like regulatory domain-containing protein [Deltaproteobacteria bacterium]|nr:carboxypeptidase-like regulatory domain-containing protein [Deltaproteobacteria bacterium]
MHPHMAVSMRVFNHSKTLTFLNQFSRRLALFSWGMFLAVWTTMGFLGCADTGSEPQEVVSVIRQVSPAGTVYGQLFDAFTRAPIDGATVVLLSGDVETHSDATGRFFFADVPASSGIGIEFRADGYSSALVEIALENDAGNLAQDNAVAFVGPLFLLPIDDTGIELRVLTAEGASMTGAKINAALNVGFVDGEQERGAMVASVVEENGIYRLGGLPDLALLAANDIQGALRISVRSPEGRDEFRNIDVDKATGEGQWRISFSPEEAVDNAFSLVSSNVADLLSGGRHMLPTILPANEVVTLTFSQPVLAEALFIVAQDAYGQVLTTGIDTTANPIITLTSVGGWPQGREVQLLVDAISQSSGEVRSQFSVAGSFFAEQQGGVQLLSGVLLRNGAGPYVCPYEAGVLQVRLSAALGGRAVTVDGTTPIVDAGKGQTFSPVTVTSTSVPPEHPLALGNGVSVLATLVEPTSGAGRSGFAPMLRIPWSPALALPLVGGGAQTQLSLVVTFNDVAEALARGSSGTAIVRTPNGAPVTQVAGTVTVALGPGTATPASCQ